MAPRACAPAPIPPAPAPPAPADPAPPPPRLVPVPELSVGDVPTRPRWRADRPVLRRGPGAVQVGLDPAHAVVLDGLGAGLAALVAELDGTRSRECLVARAAARGGDPVAAWTLLTDLTAAGLLTEPAPGSPGPVRDTVTVTVRGGGRIGAAVAVALAGAGVGGVDVRAEGVVGPADVGSGLRRHDVGRGMADAIEAAVHRVAPEVRTGPPGPRPADLVVLAGGLVADPVPARRLTLARRPHLPVTVREGRGVVGPLVVPGRTPCLGCAERHRADEDPDRRQLLAQLTGRRATPSAGAAAAVAALAVEQVLALLDQGEDLPAALGAELSLDPRRAHVHHDAVSFHDDCPCVHDARRERSRGRGRAGHVGAGEVVARTA